MLIATQARRGWVVDDAAVPDGDWDVTGRSLWDAFATHDACQHVRFVCPTPEPERRRFAESVGLRLTESWWHLEVPAVMEPGPGQSPQVVAAAARTVPAPPVYDPGGPILFVQHISNVAAALPSAREQAERLGCPLVVVAQPHDAVELAPDLAAAGFRRHCDFFEGTTRPAGRPALR